MIDARRREAGGHVGILGISENEITGARWIGVNPSELLIERFHGSVTNFAVSIAHDNTPDAAFQTIRAFVSLVTRRSRSG
jgi:hypothetical protein